jgi:hypothetical protein
MSEQDEAYRSPEGGDEAYRSQEGKDVEAHELVEELTEKHGEGEDKKDDFEAHELVE